MAEISAAAVKSLRERTGLPMMDCKKALQEAGGDVDKAVELLRKAGAKLMEKRPAGPPPPAESPSIWRPAPMSARWSTCVARAPGGRERAFRATGQRPGPATGHRPGAASPEALLAQPSPEQNRADAQAAVRRSEQPHPRGVQARADRSHRRPLRRLRPSQRRRGRAAAIRGRQRGTGPRHLHARRGHAAAVLYEEELDPAVVAKEREILSEAARKEGKPENIIAKMVEGRLRNSTPSVAWPSSRSSRTTRRRSARWPRRRA